VEVKPIQRATIGRIVTVVGVGAQSNGAVSAAGIVTRVWGEPTEGGKQMVNLTVFPDFAPPIPQGSVWLYASAKDALDSVSGVTGIEQFAAYVPERA
jgi:hypothetical protein